MWEVVVAVNASRIARVWPNPTGAAYRNGQLIKYGLKSSADITGILRWGQRLEIEIKTGNATQTEGQEYFEEMINNFCGVYLVGRTVDSVLRYLQTLEQNHNAKLDSLHGQSCL